MKQAVSFSFICNKNSINNREDYLNELIKQIEQTLQFEISDFDGFLLTLNKNAKEYLVDFSFRTYSSLQLRVQIHTEFEGNSIGFEQNIHDLKYKIKNLIIRDWEECIWFEDEQSTALCNELYSNINSIENKFRNFINEVLAKVFGSNWWAKIAPNSLKTKFEKRIKQYRKDITEFNNVNIYLLGLDIDDLLKVINISIEKWNPSYDVKIEEAIINNEPERLLTFIKNQMVVEKKLWTDIFEKFIEDADFLTKWRNFTDYRNHVAHNKLLDLSLYNEIKSLSENINEILDNAIRKYNRDPQNLSAEEIAQLQKVYSEQYYSAVEADTGYKEPNEQTVLNQYENVIDPLLDDIIERLEFMDIYYCRNSLKIDTEVTLLEFTESVSTDVIAIDSISYCDGGFGESSSLTLSLKKNNFIICEYVLDLKHPTIEEKEQTFELLTDYHMDYPENFPEEFFAQFLELI
ncbi:hypothetical protein ACQVT2_14375 [Bacillus paranthracis]|uniref:hypothetical protein n=1 Tax=Bacillus paranthracis TaxID=2026186 RepID=UPI003D64B283